MLKLRSSPLPPRYLMRNGYSSGTIVTVDGGSVLV
jgi:hypothetical protein